MTIQVASTFATITHATVAWLLLPKWLLLVALEDVKAVMIEDIVDCLHPLSRLACDATASLAKPPWQIQRAFLHSSLPAVPGAVLPIIFSPKKMTLRVSFINPRDAALMAGSEPLLAADGAEPYFNNKHSKPLKAHVAISLVHQCTKCGRFDHAEAICPQVRRSFRGRCSTCSLDPTFGISPRKSRALFQLIRHRQRRSDQVAQGTAPPLALAYLI